MHDDVDAITMKRGNQTMQFVIKVPKKQGLLFCICLKRKGKVLRGVVEKAKPIRIAKVGGARGIGFTIHIFCGRSRLLACPSCA